MQKQKANKLKSQVNLKNALLTLLMVIVSVVVFAQGSGSIVGVITNKQSGETISGVTVRVIGTSKGSSSDVSGKYGIQNLVPGTYKVEYSYIGYATKQITDVEVKKDDITNLDIILENSDSKVLDQVVVTGSYKKESIGALYAQQKNSALISDGISSEQIRRSPDKNTSEALRRVSGTTIQDNKFVIVRGLSDRYNTAMLDGSVLPSTEANRRAFSFDIIPSSLIDKITISKTATPDLPADFAGGAVQITTKDIPDKNFISFGLGYGINTASTFKDFLGTKRNFQNYAGFDDGSNNLATNFPSRETVAAGLSSKWNRLTLKSLPNDFAIKNTSALPSQNYQFSVGNVKQYDNNNRFGSLFAVTYRNSQNILSDIKRQWYQYDYTDNQYKFSTNLGALANFGYTFGKNKITFKNLYNRSYDNTYTERRGTNVGTSSDNKFYAYDLMQKSLFKSTLEGEHILSEKNDKVKWTASWSNILNNQPNQMKINYAKNIDSKDDSSVPYLANITSPGKDNTRLFSKLDENVFSGEASYSSPFNFLAAPSTLKVGAGANYRKRNFDARFVGFELNATAIDPETQNEIRQLTPDKIFSTTLIDKNYFKYAEIIMPGDQYDANSLTSFGYAMLDQKFNDKLRIVYGLRLENYNVQVNIPERVVDDKKLDFLPSVNLTYNLTTKSNLRASYYRTVARPEFRELAPFSFYDFEQLGMISGNVNLKRSSINNGDLRFEIYPSAGEIFSISAFYKQFTDAIEPFRYDVNSTVDVSNGNTPKANLYGAEIEARKKLSFIADDQFFANTTAYVNLSLVHSKVNNPTDQTYIEKTRPMVGQSPYVINAGLQHNALDNKLNVNLLYNRIGKRIAQAGGQTFTSAWEAPRDILDAQIGYKVLKSKGEVKLSASDILNNPVNVYFDNKPLNKSNETLYKYKTGSNISLSFNYTF
ncbi:TonB-dependent receptor [Sphingobacterium sp. SRCM116780]|uniref:TonB-dependent receptor n=1 Tax=Sphingobacterium sp. SRCM116780 TaxID=2907623 RepID=UPI001F37B7B1|nr:TonB-dependent receptor [Sphingobacterium sp. SRCM116780]UIR56559.1 TonB-dependent receptor [Sphingobacterium sp. SRCM116780]